MSGWQTTELARLMEPRDENYAPQEAFDLEVPFVEKITFGDGAIVLRTSQKVSKTGAIVARSHDLLVSKINFLKGAVALVSPELPEVCASTHYTAYVVDTDQASPLFLWYLLRSAQFRRRNATALPNGIKTELGPKRLLALEVDLPPLDEQEELVQLFVSLSDYRTGLKEAHEQLESELRAAQARVLQDWVSTRAPERTPFSDYILDGPVNGWSVPEDKLGGSVRMLTLSAVLRGSFDQSTVKLVSPDDLERARRAMVRDGDILISRSNSQELVGRAAHVVGVEGALMYPDLLMRIRVDTERLDPQFAEVWLRTQAVRNHLMSRATGTSPTMKKINQATVKDIPFPVGLTLEEQQAVVADVARVDECVHAANQALERIDSEAEAFERAVEAERLTPAIGDLIPA